MAASWECPPLPMISLNLKESSKTSFNALKPFIASQYDENPESFANEIRQLEQLRDASLKVSRDSSGCSVLRRYYAQLHLLKSRFPQESAGMIPISFTWKDVYTGSETHQEGLQVELAPILYNIGALHSLVGGKNSRHSEQDMKEALTHYQCSAGVFAYINENFGSSGQADLSPQLVEMYKTLMLGQAQECIVEKSLKGLSKVKNLNISKIAMKVAQYYQSVLIVLESEAGAPINKKHKDWVRLLTLKISYYTTIAHLYQANSMEEQSNYGYMIAYQQLALEKVKSIGKPPRGTPDVVKEAIKNLSEFLMLKLQESLKQNEQVFHELVPDLETLEPAPGFELVKPYMFQPSDPKSMGSDIFSRLVPMRAYEAASIYSEEQAKIMRSVMSSVEQKNEELSTFMTSLNISELTTPTDNPTLPGDIMSLHRQFQSKGTFIRETESKIKELMSLSERVEEQLTDVMQMKEEEIKDERDFQERHGARPESQVCSSLWKELDSMLKYHKQANNSNSELNNMFSQHLPNLLLLAGQTSALVSGIPSLPSQDDSEDTDKDRLEMLLNKVEEMKSQRQQLIDQLRSQMSNDNILHAMIGESASSQGSVIDEYLQKPREMADTIRQNLTAQDNILKALTEANAKQAKIRQALQGMQKKREEWCISLAKSAGNFTFLQSKISEGLVFYSKLAESVARLHKRSQEVCNTRRRERQSVDRHSPAPDKRTQSSSPIPPHKDGKFVPTKQTSQSSTPGHTPSRDYTPSPPPQGHTSQPPPSHGHTFQPPPPQGHASQPPPQLPPQGFTPQPPPQGFPSLPPVRPPKSNALRGEPIQKEAQSNEEEAEGNDMTQLILDMKRNQDMQRISLNGHTTPSDIVPIIPTDTTPTDAPTTTEGVSLLLDEPVDISSVNGLVEPILIPQPLPLENDDADFTKNLMNSVPTTQSLSPSQSLPPLRPDKPPQLQREPVNSLNNTAVAPPITSNLVDPASSEPVAPEPSSFSTRPISPQLITSIASTDPVDTTEPVPVSTYTGMSHGVVVSSSAEPVPAPITTTSNIPPFVSTPVNTGPNLVASFSTEPTPTISHVGSHIPSTGPVHVSVPNTGPVIPPVSGPVIPPVSGPVIPPVSGPVIPPVSEPVIPPVSGPVIPPLSEPVIPPVSGPVIPPLSEPVIRPLSGPVIPPVSFLNGGPAISPTSGEPATTTTNTSIYQPGLTPVSSGSEPCTTSGEVTLVHDSEPNRTNVAESTGFSEVIDNTVKLSPHPDTYKGMLPQFTAMPISSLGMATPTASTVGHHSQLYTSPSVSGSGVLPPPPLSITTLQPSKESKSSISYLENLCLQQQETIQSQTKQIEEQKSQIQQQSKTLEEQRKELERYRLTQQLQEKDKVASSSNQSMLVNLLKQQQELFKTQQEQMDKLNQESEAKRSQHSELEMKLRDGLAQEQLQNQALHNQISQQLKDIQHLQHQLQASSQQIQSLQMQGQQYLNQIQERDKVLANYREEHKQIVDNLESQCRQRVQQVTQQMQELQSRLGIGRGGGDPAKVIQPGPNLGGVGGGAIPRQQQGWTTSPRPNERPPEGNQTQADLYQQYHPQTRGGEGGVAQRPHSHQPQSGPPQSRVPQNTINSPGLPTNAQRVQPTRQQGLPTPGQSTQSIPQNQTGASQQPISQSTGPLPNQPGMSRQIAPSGPYPTSQQGIPRYPSQPGIPNQPINQPGLPNQPGLHNQSGAPNQPGLTNQPGVPNQSGMPTNQSGMPGQQGVPAQPGGVRHSTGHPQHTLPLNPPTSGPPTSDVQSPIQHYPPQPYRPGQYPTTSQSHPRQHPSVGGHPTGQPHWHQHAPGQQPIPAQPGQPTTPTMPGQPQTPGHPIPGQPPAPATSGLPGPHPSHGQPPSHGLYHHYSPAPTPGQPGSSKEQRFMNPTNYGPPKK